MKSVPENPYKKESDKWSLTDYEWHIIIDKVTAAQQEYALKVFQQRDDKTSRQARDEFWARLAEHYGFKINFLREQKE